MGDVVSTQAGVTRGYTGPSESLFNDAQLMAENTDDDRYLYIVDYDEDAERKRVEYLFNNWTEGKIERPSGLLRVASNVSHEELFEQLVAKVPERQVEVYQLEDVDTSVEPDQTVVTQQVDASTDAVETFLEYILSKKKAVLQSPTQNEYEVYTKKGRTEITYSVTETEEGVSVRVSIRGYPPAPSFLAEFFETELGEYAASQSPDHQ